MNPDPIQIRTHVSDSIRLQRMETIHDEAKGQIDEPHRHNYYTVIYVQEGEGRHLIDFQSYPLENNLVFFVSPGQVHQVYPDSRPKGWVITFSKEFLHHNHISEDFIAEINLFQSFEQRPPIHLDENTRQKINLLMPLMEDAYENNMPHQIAALSAYLKLFLVYCNQVCVLARPDTQPNDSGHQLLKSFKDLVTRHFRKYHKTSDYAKMLHISPKYLNQVVKSLIGQTAKEVIQEKIILNAKRELRYTDKSIKEIAFELGFEDPLYFSSFFKTCTDLSPTAFRENG